MENKDHAFDERLKNILESPPDISPNEEAMASMYQKLEDAGPMGFWAFWAWPRWLWILLPLLLLSAGFGYLFFQVQQANQKIYDLTLQLSHQQTHLVQNDTVFRQSTVYQYDTIIKVIYLQNKVIGLGANPRPTYQQTYPFFSSQFGSKKRDLSISDLTFGFGNYAFPSVADLPKGSSLKEIQKELKTADEALTVLPSGLTSLHYPYSGIPLHPQNPQPADSTLVPQKVLDMKRPFFRVGRLVGPVIPTGYAVGLDLMPVSLLTNESGKIGFGGGLSGELAYGKVLRLTGGANILLVNYEEKNQENILNYPPGNPENPNDFLKEVYGNLAFLNIPLGAKFVIPTTRKWQPYIRTEWVMRKPLIQNIRYEYLSDISGEYKQTQRLGSGAFTYNHIRLSGGINLPFGKQWIINSGFIYHHDINPTQSFIDLNRLSIKLGMQYGFK